MNYIIFSSPLLMVLFLAAAGLTFKSSSGTDGFCYPVLAAFFSGLLLILLFFSKAEAEELLTILLILFLLHLPAWKTEG